MKQRKRSVGFMLASICTFTLLLAGCRGTSSTNNTSRTTSRLTSLQQTPSVTATALPIGTETYIGQAPSQNAWIGITTDGKTADAFVTDGSQSHPATFAQWFKGPVSNNTIDTTSANKNGNDHLQAMLTNSTASGTVTMAGGQSIAFTANALSAGTATPSATASPATTATPAASTTPSTSVNPGIYKGTGSANGDDYTAGWIVAPANMASSTATPSATATATPTATETPTPGSTPTPTVAPSTTMQQVGAVINKKTHDVTTAPTLTQDNVSSGTIAVPNEGNFKLVPCQGNQC